MKFIFQYIRAKDGHKFIDTYLHPDCDAIDEREFDSYDDACNFEWWRTIERNNPYVGGNR